MRWDMRRLQAQMAMLGALLVNQPAGLYADWTQSLGVSVMGCEGNACTLAEQSRVALGVGLSELTCAASTSQTPESNMIQLDAFMADEAHRQPALGGMMRALSGCEYILLLDGDTLRSWVRPALHAALPPYLAWWGVQKFTHQTVPAHQTAITSTRAATAAVSTSIVACDHPTDTFEITPLKMKFGAGWSISSLRPCLHSLTPIPPPR